MSEQNMFLTSDVYYGDPGKPLPAWRGTGHARREIERDAADDDSISDEERSAVASILGFDPSELWEESDVQESHEPGEEDADDEGGETAKDNPRQFAEMMADILYGLFGKDALKFFAKASDDDANVEESLRLQEKWSELDHPRGKNGRFIPKGSVEARQTAMETISRVLKGDKTPDSAEDVAKHLSILNVKQLKEVWAKHGVKVPSYVLRQQIVDAVLERLPGSEGEKTSDRDTTKRSGDGAVSQSPGATGEPVEGETVRSVDSEADREGNPEDQSASVSTDGSLSGKEVADSAASRVPASMPEVNRRLDRYEKFFRDRGQHHVSDWLGRLRHHVNNVGSEAALQSLGAESASNASATGEVQYWGVGTEEANWKNMGEFIEAYLSRNGIATVTGDTSDPNLPLISALGAPDKYVAGDFKPAGMHYLNKLDEAKDLPGLETSEDVGVIMGKEVTHLTDEVTSKLDEKYGKGKWIVKCYDDNAAAGYGIFFPQRVAAIVQDSRNTIWSAGENLARYGFQLDRDPQTNKVIGLVHSSGDRYLFGTEKYTKTIDGDARQWADRAAAASNHERGVMLPEGSFMAQPAFPAVGISDAERAAGKTWHEKNEGRVHLVTRPDGSVEVIPHATWLKGGNLPVVFEDDDTRAMAKAAQDAINRLPLEARKGQVYAPDVMKTADGYRVVELNAQGDFNGSGYLHDNHFTIDAYVSYLTGRVPQHVHFIRSLLSKKKATTESLLPEWVSWLLEHAAQHRAN